LSSDVIVVAVWVGPGAFEDVLDEARRGDESAFAVLWRWLHPPLLRWLGVVVPAGVDDVASEVWLSVVRGLDSFDGGEQEFRGWLFTIARRRALDWARRRRRQPATTGLEGVEVAAPGDANEALWAEAEVEAALALLRQLRPDQAEVVALRVIAGLTVTETAAVVNKSEGAVRVSCHRGLRALARRLHAEIAEGVTR
jgi:RNA polymerase sigma-70 factor (ECF subfamily)